MPTPAPHTPPPHRSPFDAPSLIARRGHSSLLTPDGELLSLSVEDTRTHLSNFPPPLLIHGPSAMRALNLPPQPQPVPWFDLLELFLFVHPARSVAPTPRGMALALNIEPPPSITADFLPRLCEILLDQLHAKAQTQEAPLLRALLVPLTRSGWAWSHEIAHVIGSASGASGHPHDAIRIWRRLPKWEDEAQRPPPSAHPIEPNAARERLREILGTQAEIRPGQADFSSVATAAFEPREAIGTPTVVLAEAGTGTGKTLGYIAPASLWAERNDGVVWLSTYTRHLQKQLEKELHRLYPDKALRRQKVVVRKGRENYLCLLNMEDMLNATTARAASSPDGGKNLLPLALIARWAEASQDGDLMGGDLPGWFGEVFGQGILHSIADRRGECIHASCPHYQSCFVEHGIRRAKHADLVVANHALIMAQASWNAATPEGIPDEDNAPSRYVFDEGHHVPDAADSAFSTVLCGLEAAELRRWLLGAEGSRSRARGLLRRIEDLLERVPTLDGPVHAVLSAAHALPAPGWSERLTPSASPAEPTETETDDLLSGILPATPHEQSPSETFLRAINAQLRNRRHSVERANNPYPPSECDLFPAEPGVIEAAQALAVALHTLKRPLQHLSQKLAAQLDDDPEMDASTRQRIEAMIRSLYRRATMRVTGWIHMLDALSPEAEHTGQNTQFVDFIRTEPLPRNRSGGGTHDIGLHRHWLDPTIPFAAAIQTAAHGLLLTSATLRDQSGTAFDQDGARDWQAAEIRLGATHFMKPPIHASVLSPFDYANQTRAYVITDVSTEPASLAWAFQSLFEASGGGALGLFTAIKRLRDVHQRIHERLEEQGIPLYAQHVDAMDNATLVDIFRTEIHSCLLGTDAMRDGVDVPGEALRMVVFEKTPWPRPDILHRERRRVLADGHPSEYDDRLTRMKLRQAFGRLIRHGTDRGVFVILDRRMPSRLLSAFPPGVTVQRMSLTDTLTDIQSFFAPPTPDDTVP